MKKIIEYASIIHTSYKDESLDKMINQKIQEGFQPYGYPCAAGATKDSVDGERESDFLIVQAMVKYED